MLWLYLCTALTLCGIAVLGVLGIRVYVAAEHLARQVGDSSRRIASAAEECRRSAEPLGTRAGEIARR
jgi:hypothetical protein